MAVLGALFGIGVVVYLVTQISRDRRGLNVHPDVRRKRDESRARREEAP